MLGACALRVDEAAPATVDRPRPRPTLHLDTGSGSGAGAGADSVTGAPPGALAATLVPARSLLPDVMSDAGRGQTLFAEYCTGCHGQSGRGGGGSARTLLIEVPSFRASALAEDRSPAEFFRTISRGATGSRMPRFDHLFDEAELWDLAFYVWWLTADENWRGGRSAYRTACSACHGSYGLGSAQDPGARGHSAAGVPPLAVPGLAAQSRASLAAVVESAHPDLYRRLGPVPRARVFEQVFQFLYWSP